MSSDMVFSIGYGLALGGVIGSLFSVMVCAVSGHETAMFLFMATGGFNAFFAFLFKGKLEDWS